MAQNQSKTTLSAYFFKPLVENYALSDDQYDCQSLTDIEYLQLGVERCISSSHSGNGFLQNYQKDNGDSVSVGHFFEAIKSQRRLSNTISVNSLLRAYLSDHLEDPLSEFDECKKWHFYAADGHYHQAALFDSEVKDDASKAEPSKPTTGHFFALDLRSHHLGYIDLAQPDDGKKSEHDMKMLKRQSLQKLKNGAMKGEKVFYFWDRACIDYGFWKDAKFQGGVYFATLAKSNTATTKIRDLNILDYTDERNEGIHYDRLVSTSGGYEIREILYTNPEDGKVYKYLTSEMSLPAWLIVLLYKHRWDVEKVFDELKTKCEEKRSWVSSETAKKAHGLFLCLAHNLMLLVEEHIKKEENIEDEVEKKKSEIRKRPNHPQPKVSKISFVNGFFKRATQRTLRFIRWLRNALYKKVLYNDSVVKLAEDWGAKIK